MAKRERPRAGKANRKARRPAPARSSSATATRTAPALPTAPPQPLPAPPRPAAEAVIVFEAAMQALQRHSYAEAADHFNAVLMRFPKEQGLGDRCHVYIALCERELKRQPAQPRTIEERITAATAALNDGDDETAEKLVRGVLAESPRYDLALYLLAAVEARRGANDEALDLLGKAIGISPEIRAQARHDADFEDLRTFESFRQLLEAPAVPQNHHGAPRRPRRGR